MAKTQPKPDLRSGLPGHGGALPKRRGPLAIEDEEALKRSDDTPVESDPDIVSPEVGKNIPSGQTTKG
jgi:hypothetical protein